MSINFDKMDTAAYDKMVREARIKFQAMDNRTLSHQITVLSKLPRSLNKAEREAILTTVASRLWEAN
jgi:uncharacterized circularly permuted ATP-grasp superfamily protein